MATARHRRRTPHRPRRIHLMLGGVAAALALGLAQTGPIGASPQGSAADPPTTGTTAPDGTAPDRPGPDEPVPAPAGGPVATWGEAADVGGPNGLFVGGPNGYLYQASVTGDRITVLDPSTGEIVDSIGAERGVHGPDDVYVTADGTIYWTEIFAGNVGRLSPDGTWRLQHVEPGVNPITMNAEGRLFTALDFLGNGLYELDPELIAPPKLLLADIDTLNGFAFGPDGYLYGPLFFDHRIVKIDVDATPPTVETVVDGFRVPSGVEFDSKGRMIVTDFAEGQVFRYDADGGRELLLDIDSMIDNSAVGPDDSVYSSAFGDGQVWAVDPSGETRKLTNSGLMAAGGLARAEDGSLFVADWFAMKQYRGGELVNTLYDRFDPQGEGMSGPNTVAIDAKGDLIMTGSFGNVLQVLDAEGDVSLDVRDLKVPTNAIMHGDRLVAAQAGNGNGTGPGDVIDVETRKPLIDGLVLPTGLASDGETLYVADWSTGTIWAVGAAGKAAIAVGFNHPEGIALTGDGHLLVAEEGIDQVTSLDLTTGDRRAAAHVALGNSYAPGLIPFGMLTGIAIDPAGGFWVTSDTDNVIYKFA